MRHATVAIAMKRSIGAAFAGPVGTASGKSATASAVSMTAARSLPSRAGAPILETGSGRLTAPVYAAVSVMSAACSR